MSKETIVRIMGQIIADGVGYEPNQLVKNITNIDAFQQRGMVSTSAADIKYCAEVLKAEVIDHAKAKQAFVAENTEGKAATDDVEASDPSEPKNKPAKKADGKK